MILNYFIKTFVNTTIEFKVRLSCQKLNFTHSKHT